jgi:hypothetical protein
MRPARTPALLLVLGSAFAAVSAPSSRAPVLVELFTSEGCSSCPPADRLLEQLDPRAIVLSEHVDYWDHQGWKDPYSSPLVTLRQQNYGRQFGIDGVYTPQMVIDGAAQFNGSDSRRALAELAKAGQRRKAALRIARTDAGVDVRVENAPRSAAVYLVLADGSATSQVAAGENSGRRLHHVAIVRSLRKIGAVKRGEDFHKLVELPREDASRRVIVFLQDSGMGPVSGAAVLEQHIPNGDTAPRRK